MKFTLTIHCDNAAFEEYGLENEVARILRVAAMKVGRGKNEPLRDENGNTVGSFAFDDEGEAASDDADKEPTYACNTCDDGLVVCDTCDDCNERHCPDCSTCDEAGS